MTSNHISNLVRSVTRLGASQLGCDELLDRSLFMLDVSENGQHDNEMAKKLLCELYRVSAGLHEVAINDQWRCGYTISQYLSSISNDAVINAWQTGGSGSYPLVPGRVDPDDILIVVPEFVWCMAVEAAHTYCLDSFLTKFSTRVAASNGQDKLSDHMLKLYTSIIRKLATRSAEWLEDEKQYCGSSLSFVLGAISDDLAGDVARYVASSIKS